MKCIPLLSAAALLTTAVTALAHPHLQSANPPEGSVVATAPSNVVLNFAEAARVTAAWIQRGTEPKQKVGPLPAAAAKQVAIPLPHLTSGRYELTWRVVGDDGHILPGKLHFTLRPAAGADSARH